MRAIYLVMAVVGVAAGLSANLTAQAATIFSNYNGVDCNCGITSRIFAEAFTPTEDFDFTGASAFILGDSQNLPGTTSLMLYTSSGGLPRLELWASGPISVTTVPQLVSDSYGGAPILLDKGTTYFLGVNAISVDWLGRGSSSATNAAFISGAWQSDGSGAEQFEVNGNPVPEPASFTLLGVALFGLGTAREWLRR